MTTELLDYDFDDPYDSDDIYGGFIPPPPVILQRRRTRGPITVVVADPNGDRVAIIERWTSISYARRIGDIGAFAIQLPEPDTESTFDPRLVTVDSRFEFWRDIDGRRTLDTDISFLMRKLTKARNGDGTVTYIYEGPSAVDLLRRRIVAYAAASTQAAKTGAAADVMRAIVRENLGPSATDTSRELDVALWSVQADDAEGPTIDKAFSRRNVLEVLREISDATITLGDPVFFDVVPVGGGYQFNCYAGQRGVDRSDTSDQPLVFSADRGNLTEDALSDDYANESTFIYAGGQGEEADRAIATAEDTSRSNRSPFGRIESWQDARDTATTAALSDEASALLATARPLRTISATLVSTNQTLFGRDWQLGDRVVVEVYGERVDAWVNAVAVNVAESGVETVTATVDVIG